MSGIVDLYYTQSQSITADLVLYHFPRDGERKKGEWGATRLRQTTVTREQRPCEEKRGESERAGIDTEKAAVASESNQFIALLDALPLSLLRSRASLSRPPSIFAASAELPSLLKIRKCAEAVSPKRCTLSFQTIPTLRK